MSDKMPSSWKYISNASNRFNSFKGYLQKQDFRNSIPEALQRQFSPQSEGKQGWRAWAGQKLSSVRGSSGQERLALFPGWAARRYNGDSRPAAEAPFSVDIFVSGFASVHRAPEMASRSQKAFLRLAKGFAALPKFEGDTNPPEQMVVSGVSRSTEELLAGVKLPPRPVEASDDLQVQALERQLRELSASESDTSDSDSEQSAPATTPPTDVQVASLPSNLRKLHANLEARLEPFWSSVLPNRRVRVHVFASPDPSSINDREPVFSQEVITAADGSFEARLKLTWEQMCLHPDALHIAFGDHIHEHEFVVVAEILPPSPPSSASSSSLDLGESSSRAKRQNVSSVPVTSRISLTHAPLRVISDIDDTIKHSDVLGGARKVFHNVFVKELSDLVIPGIGQWYSDMWNKGVRFHYVSNGPFEILPVLGEFFQIADLPAGSLKLKSYAGRSLFTGLLSAPAARKRSGVVDILQSFPDSRFILIGDSGEQDMELYAELARERSHQISGVFIRQVDGDPLDDPLGVNIIQDPALNSAPATQPPFFDNIDTRKRPQRSLTDSSTPRIKIPSIPIRSSTRSNTPSVSSTPDYFTSPQYTAEPEEIDIDVQTPKYSASPSSRMPTLRTPRTPRSASTTSPYTPTKSSSTSSTYSMRMSDPEKRRYDLQTRVYKARMMIPRHIPFRLFKSPEECIEVNDILKDISR